MICVICTNLAHNGLQWRSFQTDFNVNYTFCNFGFESKTLNIKIIRLAVFTLVQLPRTSRSSGLEKPEEEAVTLQYSPAI